MMILGNADYSTLWLRFHKVFLEAIRVAPDYQQSKQMLELHCERMRAAELEERMYLAFEQFLIATASLRVASQDGELSQMGDWITWAVTAEQQVHFMQEMELGRFADFRNSPAIALSPTYEAANVMYFSGFYDYARRRTAMKEIAETLWPYAMAVFQIVMDQPPRMIASPEIMLGCMMLTWAAKESHERARKFAPFIEAMVSANALPLPHRAYFCLTLSTSAGRFSSLTPNDWARRALQEFGEFLSELDHTQLMTNLLREDEHGRIDAEAILVQMAKTRALRNRGLSTLAATRDAAQTAEFIQPYFVRTVASAASDLVLRGLQTWYNQIYPNDELDSRQVLFTVPFGETGTTVLCGTERHLLERDTQLALEEVSLRMMEFLGTYTTVAGADNASLPVPERPGHPMEQAVGLAKALQNAYCPVGLEVPGGAQCQLILPMEGHPIQATQLANWGKTWPIASSLGKPRGDRPPKSVLIWDGGTITAPMESAMVTAAFELSGATVRVITPQTCSPEKFMIEYQNAEYDVLWVASHGLLDPWSPHDVRLHLAPDNSAIALADLWNRVPDSGGRRLLVLNVCDGARFAEPGMLPRVGLAAGLSTPSQATISHLWPVRYYSSAAFGAYLSHFVSTGTPYFDAYCATMAALRKPARDVGIELRELYGRDFELTDRLRDKDEDYSDIEVWGSAAFYQ
jgi:hypothetical protein